jgi:uncharacterized FAD-dependent dehydrogenase
MIISVRPEDFDSEDALAGVEFQRKLEKAAYREGKGKIPVQLFGDFCKNRVSEQLGEIKPNTKGRWTFGNVRSIFPENLSAGLEEGIKGCEKLIPGFAREDALLLGVESRTSSPVRIERDNDTFYCVILSLPKDLLSMLYHTFAVSIKGKGLFKILRRRLRMTT